MPCTPHHRPASFSAFLSASSATFALAMFGLLGAASDAASVSGAVVIGGQPISGATVTLWATGAARPEKIGEARTTSFGTFSIIGKPDAPRSTLYLIARGGRRGPSAVNAATTLLLLLPPSHPSRVVINELTTVGSAFTAAQFVHGDELKGNPLGLKIAAGNVPNFVNVAKGGWGDVLLNPLNSTQTATLATFDTLGSLITAFATTSDAGWCEQFLAAAAPLPGAAVSDTMTAMASIARESWASPKELYALFDKAYPQPKDGSRRAAPFVPYLAWSPPDFALSLAFAGGGMYANGRFMFDAEGNLWSGQNWMPGSQSGVITSIGGGVLEMSPNGTALSPPITGFTGMGIDGIGWGTAVTRTNVWATSFNGKFVVMDLHGRPVAKESDLPFKTKFLGLMGIGVAENGDVWIADGSDNQLLYFPGGRIKDGRVVKVDGLKSPFDIVIDSKNRVWVSNSQADTVVRFAANDPTKVDTFHVGIIVRALALDAQGNVWVASNASRDFPFPAVPDGASIMEQFRIMAGAVFKYGKPTGLINVIRPDGSQTVPAGYSGNGAINVPWGLNIDGNGDVWIGNFMGRSVVAMVGAGSKGHVAGAKMGDVMHVFTGGSIQMLTDVAIDPAGDVWVANNWNAPDGAAGDPPPYPTSTWGGGSGLTVIYGTAAPVEPPRMGAVRGY